MKILLVSESYPPIVSGVSTVVFGYAKALTEKKHTVSVITSSTRYKTIISRDKGITVYYEKTIPNPIRRNTPIPIPSYKRIKHFIQQANPSIVHAHTQGLLGQTVVKIARELHIPIVATLHAPPSFVSSYIPFGPTIRRLVDNFLWRMLLTHVFPFITHIIVPSEYMRTELLKQGVKTPILVLPMWIDIPSHTPRAKKRNSTINFLSVGRLDPDKNLSSLIEAWIISQRDSTGIIKSLTIAGGGSEEKYLQHLARKDTTGSIIFTGQLDPKGVSKELLAADVVIVPGLYESQSLAALQAIAHNRRILAVESGALPEIAKRFPTHTYMFPRNDPKSFIRKLAQLTTIKQPLSRPSFAFYAKKRILQKLLQLYAKQAVS